MDSIYDRYEDKIVRMGRNLITMCERNEIFPKNDEMWNAAVTAGNKLVTTGTTWSRFQGAEDLNVLEKKAVQFYLDKYGLDYKAQKML